MLSLELPMTYRPPRTITFPVVPTFVSAVLMVLYGMLMVPGFVSRPVGDTYTVACPKAAAEMKSESNNPYVEQFFTSFPQM